MMMSALEREIIEKFQQLSPEARARIQAWIAGAAELPESAAFDYAAWFQAVEGLREAIRAGQAGAALDVVALLRAIRDGEDE